MGARCKRCGGNQFRTKDQYGEYLSCLQCGRTEEVEARSSLEAIVRDLEHPPARLLERERLRAAR